MLRQLVVFAALSVSAAAQAASTYYDFQYTGFNVISSPPDWSGAEPTQEWAPNATIKGYFRGDDLNNDNIISRNEIERFGIRFGAGAVAELTVCPERDSSVSGYTGCRIDSFSYAIGGTLSFDAAVEYSSNASVYNYYYWDMPTKGYSNFSADICCGSQSFVPTADTRFSIITAVPEPSTWAMLGGGLLIAAGAARRRSRSA